MKLTRGAIALDSQIAQILRRQVRSQDYRPSGILPTEYGVIRTFLVSRTTVRRAVPMRLSDGSMPRIAGAALHGHYRCVVELVNDHYRTDRRRLFLRLTRPSPPRRRSGRPIREGMSALRLVQPTG